MGHIFVKFAVTHGFEFIITKAKRSGGGGGEYQYVFYAMNTPTHFNFV